jgi:membrane-bound metal-dependent hydrolase YbcI (DUF457 family)
MFVGHYGVAFAVKSQRNQIPLWVLFVAVQLFDFLWAPFVVLGIEKVRMVPGITATNSLDLYYMPYTHSLVGALIWSGAAFLIYKLVVGQKALNTAAMIVALAVFSHWILDLIVHRPDLAIYDDTLKVGFGLWNYKGLEFGLEIAILIVGIIIYLKRNSSIARKADIVVFGVVLILIQTWNTFAGRRPASDRAFAITALIFYTVFASIAFLLEKRSEPDWQKVDS